MFASEIQLRTLASAKTWFMDGTFLMAPSIFSQLYVILIPLGKSAVTAIYAFFAKQDPKVYEEMIEAITDACIMHEKVVSDFEKSSMYTVKTFLIMTL